MNKNTVIDMKTSQFPFGQAQDEPSEARKILIKKRIHYKSDKQHCILQQKINILKNIYHKNIINFRYVEDNQEGMIDIFYNYVPFSFENFFEQCDSDTIKQIHKQLIQLVIHLAKNSILTSFNPSRCGVVLNADNKWQIKYYLPLYEIVITNNLNMLERSVQIFTVQSLHYLDLLTQQTEEEDYSAYKQSKVFEQKCRDSTSFSTHSRRNSQLYLLKKNKQRRLSNQGAFYQFSRRKLSNCSIRKSEFSTDSCHKEVASTLFQTIRSSNQTIDSDKNENESVIQPLKPRSTINIIERAKKTKERSKKALQRFNQTIKALRIVHRAKRMLQTKPY